MHSQNTPSSKCLTWVASLKCSNLIRFKEKVFICMRRLQRVKRVPVLNSNSSLGVREFWRENKLLLWLIFMSMIIQSLQHWTILQCYLQVMIMCLSKYKHNLKLLGLCKNCQSIISHLPSIMSVTQAVNYRNNNQKMIWTQTNNYFDRHLKNSSNLVFHFCRVWGLIRDIFSKEIS